MAGGGITNARQGYFLGGVGDFISDLIPNEIKDPVAKVYDKLIPNELKNPAGAALAATAANYAPVMMGGEDTLLQKGIGAITGNIPENNALDYLKNLNLMPGGTYPTDDTTQTNQNSLLNTALQVGLQYLMGNQGQGMTQGMGMGTGIGTLANQFNVGQTLENLIGWGGGTFLDKELPFLDPYRKIKTREAVTGTAAEYDPETGKVIKQEIKPQPAQYETRVNPLYPLAGGEIARRYAESQPRDVLPMDQTGIDFANLEKDLRFSPIQSARLADGGRIGADEGGLMNLGGMEKDYRQEGGFVPIGGEEKADDVPARLSKNEFVFTADAVRAAGGGDIDAGAEVMENLIQNLEAGGKVS